MAETYVCEDCGRVWIVECNSEDINLFLDNEKFEEIKKPPLHLTILREEINPLGEKASLDSPARLTCIVRGPMVKNVFKWKVNHKGKGFAAYSGCKIDPALYRDDLEKKGTESFGFNNEHITKFKPLNRKRKYKLIHNSDIRCDMKAGESSICSENRKENNYKNARFRTDSILNDGDNIQSTVYCENILGTTKSDIDDNGSENICEKEYVTNESQFGLNKDCAVKFEIEEIVIKEECLKDDVNGSENICEKRDDTNESHFGLNIDCAVKYEIEQIDIKECSKEETQDSFESTDQCMNLQDTSEETQNGIPPTTSLLTPRPQTPLGLPVREPTLSPERAAGPVRMVFQQKPSGFAVGSGKGKWHRDATSGKHHRQPDGWAKTQAKAAREAGKQYISQKTRKLVESRKIGPDCKNFGCKKGCFEKTSAEVRHASFNAYWGLESWDRKSLFLSERLVDIEPKRVRTKNRVRDRKEKEYQIKSGGGMVYLVCKNAFKSIFCITDSRIRSILKGRAASASGTPKSDGRGHYARR